MKRETLSSRLAFILLSAACAIGIGNVWKFPYVVGQNGGAIFVLIYLVCLILFGVPLMTIELTLGRAAKKSPVKLFKVLQKPKQLWSIYGYFCLAGNYLLLMFYTTVSGWMLYYVYASFKGLYLGFNHQQIERLFASLLANPLIIIVCLVIIISFALFILSFGLKKGLEKATNIMMISLLCLMFILAINSLLLKGGEAGLAFYLKVDFEQVKQIGLFNIILAALVQAFFTLSIGIGAMAIFSSYLDDSRSLLGEALLISSLDTLVAFVAGLIIFPACYAYGVSVNSGPKLLFVTLPHVFNHLPYGRLWGTLFFLFMVFAAFSTVLTVAENIVACWLDLFGGSRKRACLINFFLITILSLPCALGFNILSFVHPLGLGSNILDFEDYLLSNLLLPIGAIIFLLFVTSKRGFGWSNFLKEVNKGRGLKLPSWLYIYFKYVILLIVIIIFYLGINK